MEFKRARSQEQYFFRKQEIVEVASTIYQQTSYEELNFSRISENTNFTRPTIYKYFSTKEEVMLKLIIKYMDEVIAYIEKEIEILPKVEISDLANIMTRAILVSPNFMNSYSLLYSVIEKNVSIEAIKEFSNDSTIRQDKVCKFICQIAKVDKELEVNEFILKYLAFASGLYPICIKNEVQKKIIKEVHDQHLMLNFSESFEPIVRSMLEDLVK